MMTPDNRTNGNRFETELSIALAEKGFWVHVLQQRKEGQPADIVAIKGKYHTLIDCKVISDGRGFPFERIEENQKLAMKVFLKKAGEICFFALRLPDGSIWMVSAERLETLRGRGRTRMTEQEIREETWPLDEWLFAAENWSRDI